MLRKDKLQSRIDKGLTIVISKIVRRIAQCLVLSPLFRRWFPDKWQWLSNLLIHWANLLIHWAAYEGDEQLLHRLLQIGVDPDIRESMMKSTPLISAATGGQITTAKILIQAGADINARADYEGTALIWAADAGHWEMVAFLLDEGAEIDAVERGFGHTALFKAVAAGHLSTVQLLVERGADVQLRMRANLTAAQWARGFAAVTSFESKGMLECADYLESGENPLSLA